MFELVIENKGVEYVAYSAEEKREVELVMQRHIRSLTAGMAVIREVKADKGKK